MRYVRCMLPVLLALLIIAGCANRQARSTMASVAASTAAEASAVASPATVSATAIAGASAQIPLASATPIATGPTATPFPLAAGWWDNAVCYEVFVRSFYDSNGDGIGDINGLISKLDYINDGDPQQQNDLGVTCIWLMPIMESPAYHGYHVADFYTVDRDYGANEDFKRLVAEAHKRGIKVMLDLVLNHTSSENPWFQSALNDPNSPYRDWYIWSATDPGYKGPWGEQVWHKSPVRDEYYYGVFNDQLPDLNYRNPAVTAEAQKITRFWLTEMGVDGFRLDAIKHLIENGSVQENTPETHAWLRQYRNFVQQTQPQALTVGEIFDAGPVTLAPYYPDQLDSYFTFDVGKTLLTAAATGQARQFMGAARVANNNLPFQRFAPFLTNHDQDRAMSVLGDDVGKAKIAATALLTMPGLPFVYYGEEIGMLGVRGPEGPLADAPRRAPLQWSSEPQAGFTGGTPWEPLQANWNTVNIAAQTGDPQSLLNLYRRLIHLHTSHPALATGDFTPLKTSDNSVAAFIRQSADEAILVLLNFDRAPVSGATVAVEASGLLPGTYNLQPLEPTQIDQSVADLSVAENGAITDAAPLETLAPQTGYIFQLQR